MAKERKSAPQMHYNIEEKEKKRKGDLIEGNKKEFQ
jgi:hypothetical protein